MIKKVEKLWGSEEILVNTKLYCAKFLNLKKGYQCSYHYHILKDETFYVLEGDIALKYNTVHIVLHKGQSIRIPPYLKHRFSAITDTAKILEVSTHDYEDDSYRIEKSRKIGD